MPFPSGAYPDQSFPGQSFPLPGLLVVAPTVNANIGAPYVAAIGVPLQLTAALISDGGDPSITYLWSDGGAGGSFSNPNALNPTYTPATKTDPTTLTLQATNSEGTGQDTAQVTVQWAPETPSNDGPWTAEATGASVPVTAAIVDPGNPPATPDWTTNAPVFGSLADADELTAQYSANSLSPAGTFTLTCTFDNGVGSVQTQAQVTHFTNDPTGVSASAPTTGEPTVALQCVGAFTPGTDPSPTLLWTSNLPGSFSSTSALSPTFTPDQEGTYVLTLTVTDQWGNAAVDNTDNIVVTAVPPTGVSIIAPTVGSEDDPISFQGVFTAGTDPSPAFNWTHIVGPGTATFLPNNTVQNPDIIFDTPDPAHRVEFKVTDTYGYSEGATHDINITSDPTVAIDVYEPNPYEGASYTAEMTVANLPAGGSVLWKINPDAGQTGTPVISNPTNQLTSYTMPVEPGVAALGNWTLRAEVLDDQAQIQAFDEKTIVNTYEGLVCFTDRGLYEFALDGSQAASGTAQRLDGDPKQRPIAGSSWNTLGVPPPVITYTPSTGTTTTITGDAEGTRQGYWQAFDDQGTQDSPNYTIVVHEAGWVPGVGPVLGRLVMTNSRGAARSLVHGVTHRVLPQTEE